LPDDHSKEINTPKELGRIVLPIIHEVASYDHSLLRVIGSQDSSESLLKPKCGSKKAILHK